MRTRLVNRRKSYFLFFIYFIKLSNRLINRHGVYRFVRVIRIRSFDEPFGNGRRVAGVNGTGELWQLNFNGCWIDDRGENLMKPQKSIKSTQTKSAVNATPVGM